MLLAFDSETSNRLYGYAEGVMAVGSLCGGMGAGMLAGIRVISVCFTFCDKIKPRNTWRKDTLTYLHKKAKNEL